MAKVEKGNLEQFRPQTRNLNKHSQRGMGALEAAMRKHGYVAPITVAADGEAIDGSARLETVANVFDDDVLVIHHDGQKPIVMVRDDIPNATTNEARAISAEANRIAQLDLVWDAELLLEDLNSGVDLKGLFDQEELDALLDGLIEKAPMQPAEAQVDKAAELQKVWQTSLGQIWQLGRHRLICGDCTDKATVERLMQGEKADCVFTDPPYNVASDSDNFAANVSRSMNELKNADWDKDFHLLPALQALPLANDVTVYVCSSHYLIPVVWQWMGEWATHHSWCVWNKPNPMPSLAKRHWTWNGELIAYATRGKHTFNFPADGHALSVWTFNKHKDTDHPTEKPIEIPAHAIAHSSKEGAIVFDGFGGSGSTLMACEQLGRQARLIELDAGYCAVILQRYKDSTGIEPKLIDSYTGTNRQNGK